MRPRSDGLTEGRMAVACLALAVLAAGVLFLALDSHLTFIADDWELLVKRQGWSPDAFFEPFHEHIVAGSALVYKLVRAVFGMGSALPYYLFSIGAFLLSAVLLFVYARRRVGDWPALLAAVLILFLGAAFEDLLWAFQVGFFVAVAAGLGALLALDRHNDRGDRIACGLLVVALAFSTLGIAFVAGALAEVVLGRRPQARRAYIVLVPATFYALWWLGWGHAAESNLSFDNLVHLPGFVFDSAAAGITSLLGQATGDGSSPDQPHLIWGKLLLIAGAGLVGLRAAREKRVPPGLAVVLVIALAFWVLAGLGRDADRFPTSSRYQYPSAVFLLLIAIETLRGLRVPRPAIAAAAVVTGIAVVSGYSLLHREYEDRWRPSADSLRSSLAAVEIAGESADPAYTVTFHPNPSTTAEHYLAVAEDYGSPAFSEDELAVRPDSERASADLTLASALGLALVPPTASDRTLACQPLQASVGGETEVTLLRGGFTLTNQGSADVGILLSRFADGKSVDLGPLGPGVETSLAIPADNSTRPWSLWLTGAGPVRLCTTEAG